MPQSITKLHKARKEKDDEFYTLHEDIEREISAYPLDTWKDKIIYCNCDDPNKSNFWKFFVNNFNKLNLKELHATCIEMGWGTSYHWVYDGNKTTMISLRGKGDFRDGECVEILKQCDIVVTNPPFSLFREYVDQLVKHNKKFLIIGNQNAITYTDIFPLLQNNQIWLGSAQQYGAFFLHCDEVVNLRNTCWFTNLKLEKRYNHLPLKKKYDPLYYEKYDNYDAINVNKIDDIPYDYKGVIGVPTSYMLYHDKNEYNILGLLTKPYMNNNKIPCTKFYDDFEKYDKNGNKVQGNGKAINGQPVLKGKGNKAYHYKLGDKIVHTLFARVLIQKVSNKEKELLDKIEQTILDTMLVAKDGELVKLKQ